MLQIFCLCFLVQILSLTFGEFTLIKLDDINLTRVEIKFESYSCGRIVCRSNIETRVKLFYRYDLCLDSSDILHGINNYCLSANMIYNSLLPLDDLIQLFVLEGGDTSHIEQYYTGTTWAIATDYWYNTDSDLDPIEDYYSTWIISCLNKYETLSRSERLVVDRLYRTRDDPSHLLLISTQDYEVVIAMSQPLFWKGYYGDLLESDYVVDRPSKISAYKRFVLSSEVDFGLIHKLHKNESFRDDVFNILTVGSSIEPSNGLRMNIPVNFSSKYGKVFNDERPFVNDVKNNYLISEELKSEFLSRVGMNKGFLISGVLGFISSLISIFTFPFTLNDLFNRVPGKVGTISYSEMIDESSLKLLGFSYCDSMGEYYDAVSTLGIMYEQLRIREYGSRDREVRIATLLENKRYVSSVSLLSLPEHLDHGTVLILLAKTHPKYLEYKLDIIDKAYGIYGDNNKDIIKILSIREGQHKRGYLNLLDVVFSVTGVLGYNVYHDTLRRIRNGDLSFSNCQDST